MHNIKESATIEAKKEEPTGLNQVSIALNTVLYKNYENELNSFNISEVDCKLLLNNICMIFSSSYNL